jgi:hypothetical protein
VTLAIAVKGTEGIILAVDSRVTVSVVGQNNILIPATYDNATKMLTATTQRFVGAITYGNALFGRTEPRTANSYMPEFEATLGDARLTVTEFAARLGQFFLDRWNANQQTGEPAYFFVGGYNEGEAYGRLYQLSVPTAPQPSELLANTFGAQWGGQGAIASRASHPN